MQAGILGLGLWGLTKNKKEEKRMVKEQQSEMLKLNKADGKKIAKGALIAVGGALLTYLAELLPNVDFGAYTPLVAAVGGILVNAGYKLLRGQ